MNVCIIGSITLTMRGRNVVCCLEIDGVIITSTRSIETYSLGCLSIVAAGAVDAIGQDVDNDLDESDGIHIRNLQALPSYDLCFQGF